MPPTQVWHCAKCKFDLCINCFYSRVQPPCPNDHLCEWIEDHNCACDVCGKTLGAAPHWECAACNWCCCDAHLTAP